MKPEDYKRVFGNLTEVRKMLGGLLDSIESELQATRAVAKG